jgi:hypothetical protein
MRLASGMMVALALALSNANAQDGTRRDTSVAAIAADAYVYGYPAVTQFVARRIATNAAKPLENGRAPINQFGHVLRLSSAAVRDSTGVHVNMLTSTAWLDLTSEAIVVQVPVTNGRYYFVEIFDSWMNSIASIGPRTTTQVFALTGPRWRGGIPEGVRTEFHSRTNFVKVVARIQTRGPRDVDAVNAIQRGLRTTPVRSYGKPFSWLAGEANPAINMKTPVTTQVNDMTTEQYFDLLLTILLNDPPADVDSSLLARMALVGMKPGQDFVQTRFDSATWRAFQSGARAGFIRIAERARTLRQARGGWRTVNVCGAYAGDYLLRAAVALEEPDCVLPEDALFPTAFVDADGRFLNGASRYVLSFPRGEPPVRGFWSLNLYDVDHLLVQNPIDRYAVRAWDDWKKNPDGSIDIYIQRESPTDSRRANWLPAPPGGFILTLELYWPDATTLAGTWAPLAIRRIR